MVVSSIVVAAILSLDLAGETQRQVLVDRETGQYLGHPTTVLLEDGKTMLCVYPKGHGRGGIVYKRSSDGGLTWSGRLPTPVSWATSKEVPTLHRVVDAQGKKRLIMWSGLYPARLAVSEDDGQTWSELKPAGDWGGIVVMGSVVALKQPGHYLAMFHDDGRFFTSQPKQTKPVTFTLYQTFSKDGGLTWSFPQTIWSGTDVHLCEPGIIRSHDGKQLAALLRENSRRKNSHVIFSNDEGVTWSPARGLPLALTGDRHTGKYAPDGRLFISFRDTAKDSATPGDWVAWVGTYDDIVNGRDGQYRVRLMDNTKGGDCAYPGVEVLPDGTIVTTTYGHWTKGEQPYIMSVRLKLSELDERAKKVSRIEPQPLRIEVAKTDWGDASLADIRAVLLSAAGEIWKHCPQTRIDPILVEPRQNNPITLYDRGANGWIVVGLATHDRYWAQYAFQFAHEFGHILADHSNEWQTKWRNLRHANKWFEESLCETASLFALRRMAGTWAVQPPYPNWKSFAPALRDYVDKRMAEPKNQLPAGQTFAAWFQQSEAAMRQNGTQRNANCIVAAQLLPLFEAFPAGWESLAYIDVGAHETDEPLVRYLTTWRANCPAELRPFVVKVAATFAITL